MEHSTGSAPVVSLERQVESVERSIMFLRQEQLSLLHGLHLEILSLQKRCTELTQEINVKPPGRDEEAAEAEHQQLAGRWREAERLLEQQEEVQSELRWELSQKSVLVGALRASLKEKERRFLQELKERSHRTTALHHQLRRQTEAESHLAFQLHSAKQRRRQPGPAPQASAAAPPAVKPKRRGPAHLRAERARECVPRERVTGPEEPMPMPDPALFLYAYRHRPRPQPQQSRGGVEPLEEAEPGLTTAKNSAA